MSERNLSRIVCFLMLAIAPSLALAAVGKVTSLAGEGNIVRESGTVALAMDVAVEQGDVIETGAAGKVTIQFEDQSIFTVGENAKLTIDKFVYDAENAADHVSAMRVGKGFFHFVSGKLAKEKVAIETPVSTIGIRGTEFFGEVAYNGETAVSLVECCADVTNEAGTVALDREGFYTEVASKGKAPTSADLTPEHFYKTASAQLGMSIQDLGLKELTPTLPVNRGPADRKTFPTIE